MLSETTQSDLEQLLAEVDRGWCAYSADTRGVAAKTGIGGCLTEEMDRVLAMVAVRQTYLERKVAMRNALGFTTYGSMYAWNDRQRYPDTIKHRIKDALNGEYAHVE
jgi:hypothetical protein